MSVAEYMREVMARVEADTPVAFETIAHGFNHARVHAVLIDAIRDGVVKRVGRNAYQKTPAGLEKYPAPAPYTPPTERVFSFSPTPAPTPTTTYLTRAQIESGEGADRGNFIYSPGGDRYEVHDYRAPCIGSAFLAGTRRGDGSIAWKI